MPPIEPSVNALQGRSSYAAAAQSLAASYPVRKSEIMHERFKRLAKCRGVCSPVWTKVWRLHSVSNATNAVRSSPNTFQNQNTNYLIHLHDRNRDRRFGRKHRFQPMPWLNFAFLTMTDDGSSAAVNVWTCAVGSLFDIRSIDPKACVMQEVVLQK